MAKNSAAVPTFSIARGASLARGTTIDAYLSETDNDLLYEKWSDEWEYPLEFSGGVKAITCEMVVAVPFKEFKKIFGRRAADIYAAAERNADK